MTSDRVQTRYAIGQIVEGTVEAVRPYGVFVMLQDGTPAYIRRRELSLDGDTDPRELVKERQRVRAQVIKPAELGQRMELSVRATLPDPWKRFFDEHRAGDVVDGIVKDLGPRGVWVRICEGISGFVPLSEMALWRVEKPEQLLWVGDHVQAVITKMTSKVDQESGELKREVTLSIRRRLRDLQIIEGVLGAIKQKSPARPAAEAPAQEPGGEASEVGPDLRALGPILIVEDHHDVLKPLAERLRGWGCKVAEARTAGEARQAALGRPFAFALVDLDLPDESGMQLIRWLRQAGQRMPVAVTSSIERIEDHLAELRDLQVVEAFPKPFGADDLKGLLCRLAKGERPTLAVEALKADDKSGQGPYRELAMAMRPGLTIRERFNAGLRALLRETKAEDAIIFHLDPREEKVSIVAHVGRSTLRSEKVYYLIDSPVKDAIREGQGFAVNKVSEQEDRFAKLLDVLAFESCIGIPIASGVDTEYALFLFHSQPNAFSEYRVRDAWAMATLFSALVERQILDKRVLEAGRLFIAGQLAATFGHEIANPLSGLDNTIANALDLVTNLRRSSPAELPDACGLLEAALREAVNLTAKAKRLAADFSWQMRVREEPIADVNEALSKAAALLAPQAERGLTLEGDRKLPKVAIELELEEGLAPVRGSSTGLHQVFVNLMLNAIQQMQQMAIEGKGSGRHVLHVSSKKRADAQGSWIEVRFSDTGPGIHRQLWDKIFELGFSTRPNGTGLGLYIAKELMEAMGGRIRVEESRIPFGTTFLVELPSGDEKEVQTAS